MYFPRAPARVCVDVSRSNMKSFVLHRFKQQFGVVCATIACGIRSFFLFLRNSPSFDGSVFLLSFPLALTFLHLLCPLDSILSFHF